MSRRFADAMGIAMLALFLTSLGGCLVAINRAAPAAWWFLGAMLGSAATMVMIGLLRLRIGRDG